MFSRRAAASFPSFRYPSVAFSLLHPPQSFLPTTSVNSEPRWRAGAQALQQQQRLSEEIKHKQNVINLFIWIFLAHYANKGSNVSCPQAYRRTAAVSFCLYPCMRMAMFRRPGRMHCRSLNGTHTHARTTRVRTHTHTHALLYMCIKVPTNTTST